MFRSALYFVLILSLIQQTQAQIGINTTTPNGAFEVNSSTNGIVIPKVALTSRSTASPIVNPQGGSLVDGTLVFNTATAGSGNTAVSPGFYYWLTNTWVALTADTGKNWSTTGNSGTVATTNFIGTADAIDLVTKTNNAERIRVTSGGQVSINNASPGSTDLFTVTGSTTYPFAINAYTTANGSGLYGAVSGGTTTFGGVQGDYKGTAKLGSGINGYTSTTTAGTDFLGANVCALYGELATGSLSRCFGTMGVTGDNLNTRTGGVIGTDYIKSGALGYYANNGNDYSLYGFGTAVNTGSTTGKTVRSLDTSIGMGIYGGVIGGWIKGNEYGSVFTGDRFSSYHLGKVITSEQYVMVSGTDQKTVSYATSSLSPDVSLKGKSQLVQGKATVVFPKEFTDLLDPTQEVVVTCTPMGETNGVFLQQVNTEGFSVAENKQGTAGVVFHWMAVGTRKMSAPVSTEVLAPDFEDNLQAVMHDENTDGGKAVWVENGKVFFGEKAPLNPVKVETAKKNSKRAIQQNSLKAAAASTSKAQKP
ncbi:MAG: hypothetical protein CFE24_04070 [Flavobacterium sp. BFFFF2]|nr:MAG: hypothetical protein CFE24_04070 [Flavobacterium sp. BFFFF2]